MHFSTTLGAFLTLTLVTASYPYQVNTTTPSAVFFRIFSYNFLNGRTLQLRPDPSVTGRQLVVIDATSPVLWAELKKGVIYSQNKTDENQRYTLGPVSHLRNVSVTKTSTLSEFYFQNATKADPAMGGFTLEFPTQDAVYDLYHATGDGIANGWVACDKGGFWQLFYYGYTGDVPALKGCQFLGVETTLAPYEAN